LVCKSIKLNANINICFLIGDANRLDFRQFALILARFRRGKATTDLNTKEKKLLFLFSVCSIRKT